MLISSSKQNLLQSRKNFSRHYLSSKLGVKVSTVLISGKKKRLYFIHIWKKTTENPAGLSIKTWCDYTIALMTESTQVESTLCSLLPCTLHIFTRTRLCQTNYGIIISTLLHSFCSSPSDHRELRTKLCPSLDKAFLFTNQGFLTQSSYHRF